MPTYDFRCEKCGHHFEAVLLFGSTARPLCPKCRHRKTEKLITPPTIHFKGSGFFKTDNQKIHPSATSLPQDGERPSEGEMKGKKKEGKPKKADTTKKEPTGEGTTEKKKEAA